VKAPLPELAVITDPRAMDAILEHALAGCQRNDEIGLKPAIESPKSIWGYFWGHF
jgi:hypothetical protein